MPRRGWRLRAVGFTFGPVVLLLLLAVVLRVSLGIGVGDFTQDHAQLFDGPFYAGAYSSMGLVCWGVTAAICLLTALLLPPGRRESRRLFSCAAALSTLLLLDDMLLLHEIVLPRYFNILQPVVLAVLVVLTTAFLVVFRQQILAERAGFLIAAMSFFALSVGLDMLPHVAARYLLEDGAKMFGIAAWCSFWVQRSALELGACLDTGGKPTPVGD